MDKNKVYGTALVLGALGTVITMIFHPTGADLLQEEAHAARLGEIMAISTHALAIFSYPVLCFGMIGLYRRLSHKELGPTSALLAFFFAAFTVIIAATASGLIGPTITREILSAEESRRSLLHAILDYNFAINQAFTKIFVVASSISILLWSMCFWREARFEKAIAVFGAMVSVSSLIAFFSGHLRLDVHGFGLLAFAQAAWLILTGLSLFRTPAE